MRDNAEASQSEASPDQTVLDALYEERSDLENERSTIEERIETMNERVNSAADRYDEAKARIEMSRSGDKQGESIEDLNAQKAFAKQEMGVGIRDLENTYKDLDQVNGRLETIEDKISSVVDRLSSDQEGDDKEVSGAETQAADVSMGEPSKDGDVGKGRGETDPVGEQGSERSQSGRDASRVDEGETSEGVLRGSERRTADTLQERELEQALSVDDVKEERLERIAEKSSDVERGFVLAYKNPEAARERFEEIAFRDGVSDNTASYDAANRALRTTPEVFGEVRGAEMDNRMPNTQRIGALSWAEKTGAAHSDMMKERREFQQDYGESVATASSKGSTLAQIADIDRVERDAYLRARAAGSMADAFKEERQGLQREFDRGVRNVYEDGDQAMTAYETNARAYSPDRARQVMIYPADHLQNGASAYADPGPIGTKNPDDLTQLVSIDQRLSEVEIKEKVARGIQEREQNIFQESYKWNEPTNEATRAAERQSVSGEQEQGGRRETGRTETEPRRVGSLETDAASREATRRGVEGVEGGRATDRSEEPNGRGSYDGRAQEKGGGSGNRDSEDARGRGEEGGRRGDTSSESRSIGRRSDLETVGGDRREGGEGGNQDRGLDGSNGRSPSDVGERVQGGERNLGGAGQEYGGDGEDGFGAGGRASSVPESREGGRTGNDGRFAEGPSRDIKQAEGGAGEGRRMAGEERRGDGREPVERRVDRLDEQDYGAASDRRAEEPRREARDVSADRDVRYDEGRDRDGTGSRGENRTTRSDDASQASGDGARGGSVGRNDRVGRGDVDRGPLSQGPSDLNARLDAALTSARRADKRKVPVRPEGETFFERAEREGVFGKSATEINERAAERRAGETLRGSGVSREEANQIAGSVRAQVSDGAREEKVNRMMRVASTIDRSDELDKDATMLESVSTVRGYDDALERRTKSAGAFEDALSSRFKSPREAREAFESRVDSEGFERSMNDLQKRPETFGRLRSDWLGPSWKDMENAETRVETAAQGIREYREGTVAEAASRSEVQRSVERAVAERKGETITEAERQRAKAGVEGLQNEFNLVRNERSQLPSNEQSKRELVGMMRSADGQTQERFRSRMEGAVASEERKEAMERMLDSNERVDQAFGRIYSNPKRARIAFEQEAYREGVTTSSNAYKESTRRLYNEPERFGDVRGGSQTQTGAEGGTVGASMENQKEAILASREYTRDNETVSKMMSSGSKEAAMVKNAEEARASRSAAAVRATGPAYQVTRGVWRQMTKEIERY